MNGVELYVSVAVEDTVPIVMLEDKDVMQFLRRNATTVVTPDTITEESAVEGESSATDEESAAAKDSTAEEESSAVEDENTAGGWVPGEAPEEGDAFAAAEPYAAPAAGTYSSGKFSGGQSFYVPWDASYMNLFVGYMSKSVGAIIYVAVFCSLAYFGIQILLSVIENFKNRKG